LRKRKFAHVGPGKREEEFEEKKRGTEGKQRNKKLYLR